MKVPSADSKPRSKRVLAIIGAMQAAEQLGYATWPQTYRNIVEKLNPRWLTYNFGREAIPYTTLTSWMIIDQLGAPIFSSETDGPPNGETWSELSAAAAPAMEKALAIYTKVASTNRNFMQRLPGAAHEGLYVNDFAILKGKPSILTVTPVVLLDAKTPDKRPPLLISTKTITADTLEQLKHLVQIKHAEILTPADVIDDGNILSR